MARKHRSDSHWAVTVSENGEELFRAVFTSVDAFRKTLYVFRSCYGTRRGFTFAIEQAIEDKSYYQSIHDWLMNNGGPDGKFE